MLQHALGWQIGVQVLIDLTHDAKLQDLFGQGPQLLLECQEVAVVQAASGLDQHRRSPARLAPQSGVRIRGGACEDRGHQQDPPALAQRAQRLNGRHGTFSKERGSGSCSSAAGGPRDLAQHGHL